jgi:hypothetical protein
MAGASSSQLVAKDVWAALLENGAEETSPPDHPGGSKRPRAATISSMGSDLLPNPVTLANDFSSLELSQLMQSQRMSIGSLADVPMPALAVNAGADVLGSAAEISQPLPENLPVMTASETAMKMTQSDIDRASGSSLDALLQAASMVAPAPVAGSAEAGSTDSGLVSASTWAALATSLAGDGSRVRVVEGMTAAVPVPLPAESTDTVKRVLHACRNCVRAKTACDDLRPCSRCARLGVPCDDTMEKRALKRACSSCKRSKVKCDIDDVLPKACTRCTRLGTGDTCTPHEPHKRPKKSNAHDDEAALPQGQGSTCGRSSVDVSEPGAGLGSNAMNATTEAFGSNGQGMDWLADQIFESRSQAS